MNINLVWTFLLTWTNWNTKTIYKSIKDSLTTMLMMHTNLRYITVVLLYTYFIKVSFLRHLCRWIVKKYMKSLLKHASCIYQSYLLLTLPVLSFCNFCLFGSVYPRHQNHNRQILLVELMILATSLTPDVDANIPVHKSLDFKSFW